MTTLKDKTLFITGATRGIGKAMALRAARDGANIAVIGKTREPHPTLPGTLDSARKEIEAAGGHAIGCQCDVRFEEQVQAAVDQTVATFGGIDVLVNNASAISLTGTEATTQKRFDLMHQVNVRATFMCSKLCLPHLKRSRGQILTLSPPLDLNPRWFAQHLAYTLSKYGMSLCVLGLAEELRQENVRVNALWPRTAIATAAVEHLGGKQMVEHSRKPEIVSDAAYAILTAPDADYTGQFLIDEDVLRAQGVDDFSQYAVKPGVDLLPDLFVQS